MMKRNLIRYLLPVAVITALAVILIFINAYSLGKREADGSYSIFHYNMESDQYLALQSVFETEKNRTGTQ